MTIRDLMSTQKNFKKFDGEIGIELETETKKKYNSPEFYFWLSKVDHSLRDYGMEYVLKSPIKYDLVNDALYEFRDKTAKIPFISDSFSTSTHVHLNFLEESAITLGNFITLYFMFENLLIRFSGPTRYSNLFCLPARDAEVNVDIACQLFSNISSKNVRGMFINENSAKYAALNLYALGAYGSLEIRSFRGDPDIEKTKEWIDILYKMYDFSRLSGLTPKHILGLYREKGIKLLDEVFEKHSKVLKVDDYESMVDKNIYYAARVAFSVSDWSKLDIPDLPPFKPTDKILDKYAVIIFGKPWTECSLGEQEMVYRHAEEGHKNEHINNFINSNTSKTRSKKTVNLKVPAWNLGDQVLPINADQNNDF